MDKFEDAFDSLGIDEQDVMVEGAKEAQITINAESQQEKKRQQAMVMRLTPEDRQLAVSSGVVPEEYRNSAFNVDRIKRNLALQTKKSKGLYKIYRFYDYIGICESILTTIRMGQLPTRSYLIGAPNGFGKTSFVNECLITLKHNGCKVVPYISLLELAGIRVADEQRLMQPYKKFKVKTDTQDVFYTEPIGLEDCVKKPQLITNGYSYSEYINADCLFVSFTDIVSKDIESHTLYQLLNIRGAKGLPTIVMISTSLVPYENDVYLKEYVWDEIKDYDENSRSYDRVYHISCYKRKEMGLGVKSLDGETGIVS